MCIKAFDDKKSILHILLGLTTGILLFNSPVAGYLIEVVYIAYQIREEEDMESKAGDILEFYIGMLTGVVIAILHVIM